MAKRSTFVKPEHREFLRARVLGSKQISPNFVRVTVGGEELRGFAPLGFDQWFRMFLPPAGASASTGTASGQTELRLPRATGNLWYAQYLAIPKSVRPVQRNYTVRAFRTAEHAVFGQEVPELDIDFAVHGSGPASAWADAATPGAEMALLDEGLIYNPPPGARWQLLVGDESALPAILGILDSAPADLRAEAYVEVAHIDDVQPCTAPAGVNLHWLVRSDPDSRPGMLALETVSRAELPDGPSYTFVAGESALSTGLRRHLVHERHVPKSDITFTGYWR